MSNWLAYQYLDETVNYLYQKNLIKFDTKKIVGDIERTYEKYRATCKRKLGAGNIKKGEDGNVILLWDRMNIEGAKRINDEVQRLEWRVKNHLKRNKIVDDDRLEMVTKMVTVRLMLELATQHYESYFKVMGEEFANGKNFKDMFPEFNFEPMLEYWKLLVYKIVKTPVKLNFTNTCWVKKVYDRIAKKLVDSDLMNECALRALDKDPYYSDKAAEMRKEGYEYKKKTNENNE